MFDQERPASQLTANDRPQCPGR